MFSLLEEDYINVPQMVPPSPLHHGPLVEDRSDEGEERDEGIKKEEEEEEDPKMPGASPPGSVGPVVHPAGDLSSSTNGIIFHSQRWQMFSFQICKILNFIYRLANFFPLSSLQAGKQGLVPR